MSASENVKTAKGRIKKGPGGHRHFTHPDYGLVHTPSLKRVALALNYIDANGVVRKVMPTWNYHTESGFKSAQKFARVERDRRLALPEYQAYLRSVFVDTTGKSKSLARVVPNEGEKTIEGLVGLYAKVQTTHPKVKDKEVFYFSVLAHAPKLTGGRKIRSWSVRKYGLSEAILRAATWRAEFVGGQPPSLASLTKAERSVRQQFAHLLAGIG